MDLIWVWDGFEMDLRWIWMDLGCIWDRLLMGWIWDGFGMDLDRLFSKFQKNYKNFENSEILIDS